MILRGRLLFPLWVTLSRLDTVATEAADPDRGGFHPTFREPRPVATNPGKATASRAVTTVYMEPLILRAQIKRGSWQRQRQGPSGNIPDSRLSIVLLARDLEQRGLIDTNGEVVLKVNDKLTGIYENCGAAEHALAKQTQDVRDIPGLKCVECSPAGEGLGGGRNLFVMYFEPDDHGILRG